MHQAEENSVWQSLSMSDVAGARDHLCPCPMATPRILCLPLCLHGVMRLPSVMVRVMVRSHRTGEQLQGHELHLPSLRQRRSPKDSSQQACAGRSPTEGSVQGAKASIVLDPVGPPMMFSAPDMPCTVGHVRTQGKTPCFTSFF